MHQKNNRPAQPRPLPEEFKASSLESIERSRDSCIETFYKSFETCAELEIGSIALEALESDLD